MATGTTIVAGDIEDLVRDWNSAMWVPDGARERSRGTARGAHPRTPAAHQVGKLDLVCH